MRGLAPRDTLDRQLVRRIGKRVYEADGDRLHVLRQQRIDLGRGIGFLERALDMALGVDALVHHTPQIAFNQRRGLLPGDVVEAGHAQRADLQHVAEALGGHEAHLGALVLEDGVGGNRRAVANLVQR